MQLTLHPTRRKAISGILAAVIFFAMLFTAGMSLILYTFNSFNSQNQAEAVAIQSQQAKSAESLLLRSCDSSTKNQLPDAAPYNTTYGYKYKGANVCVWIQNDGSVPVTLLGMWILDSTTNVPLSGYSPTAESIAPVTSYPTGASVFSSGLTLNPGNRTILDIGAAANSIKTSSDSYSITFVTLTGNQFSAVYPPPAFNININSGESLTTQLSQVLIPPGGSVSDTATLAGVPVTTTGNITFYWTYSNTCPAPTPIYVSTVTNIQGSGNYGPSLTENFPNAGTYYWYANFTDSSGHQISSPCEPLTVGTPTITLSTTLSPTSVSNFPAGVTDTATISGTSDATGYTVKYFYFTDGSCSTPAGGNDAGVVTVTGISVPHSNQITFQTKGNYSFKAYLYDTTGTFVTSSTCEPLPVNSQPISITTSLLPPILSSFPTTVVDTSVISGISSAVGYSVTYFYFGNPVTGISDGSCSKTATAGGGGNIVSGTAAPASNPVIYQEPGNYSWDAELFDPSGNLVATSACEQLQTLTTVSSAFGLGFISLDFNSYKAEYTAFNCQPGSSGCTLLSEPGGFVKGAPLAYTIPTPYSTDKYLVFSVNITNTDPLGRNIILDPSSVLEFIQVPTAGTGGGTAGATPWYLGSVDGTTGAISTTFPTAGIEIPNKNTAPTGVTIYFAVTPGSNFQKYPPPGVEGVFMYLHGMMGSGCTTLQTCATPIGQNEPLVVTLFTGASISLSTSSGPLGTTVTVSGSSFTANSPLAFSFDGNVLTTSPPSVTSSGSGAVPSGVTFVVPTSSGGAHTVEVSDASGNAAYATFTVTPAPALTLAPNTGTHGLPTVTTLSGSNYAASHNYSYCLSTSALSVDCVSSVAAFNSTSNGAIPSATNLTVDQPTAGIYYVIVYSSSTSVIAASAAFTEA